MERYNFKLSEEKWQKYWLKEKTFKSEINKDKKILLFGNVSISFWKIHMGHVRNYTIRDVLQVKILKDIMYCILWAGTLLECQLKMLQNKII